MNTIKDITLLTGYCGLIYWLSDQPSIPVPMWFEHQDKLHHAGAYFILGGLTWRSLRHFIAKPRLLAAISLIFCSLYAVSDEWHQSFVEGRTSDIYDWLADTIGAGIALIVLLKFTSQDRFR